MKGRRHSMQPGSTLVYPGNSFKYSPIFPPGEPQHMLKLFDVTPATLLRRSASAASAESSGKLPNGSTNPSHAEKQTHGEPPKDASDAEFLHRRSRNPSQTFEVTHSAPEEDRLERRGQNQARRKVQEVTAEVVQEEEIDIEEKESSRKHAAEEVDNGPKKLKTWSVFCKPTVICVIYFFLLVFFRVSVLRNTSIPWLLVVLHLIKWYVQAK